MASKTKTPIKRPKAPTRSKSAATRKRARDARDEPSRAKVTSAPKRAAQRRKRVRKDPQIEREVGQHPFPPDTAVTVHHELDVDIERKANREPASHGIGKVKVTKNGSLKIKVPSPGTYAVAGEVDGQHEYVLISVKGG